MGLQMRGSQRMLSQRTAGISYVDRGMEGAVTSLLMKSWVSNF